MESPHKHTVIEVLRLSTGYLEEKGIESPRLTAEILLSDVLGCQRIDLYLWFDRPMEESELSKLRKYLRLRSGGKPVDYIIKKTEFYGLKLNVDDRVMIPRPETEILVEKILVHVEEISMRRSEGDEFLFLDLGTGSGAIALALLDQLPGSTAVGTDISHKALEVACSNAVSLDLSHRFNPVLCDVYQTFKNREQFDLVVSNPPYISVQDKENLPREVRDHEPEIALYAGADGLSSIEKIVGGAPGILKKGGLLAMEIGDKQGEDAANLIKGTDDLVMISIEKDLNGIERVVLAVKEEE
jgi:release factor glutamine methyltransferase